MAGVCNLLVLLHTIALANAAVPGCFMCSLSKPTLPPLDTAPAGVDLSALQEVFNHSFDLSRTIYTAKNNRFNRKADYWFKQVQLPGQPASTNDYLYQLVTGDITAMWVRDSVWQVIPYILSAKEDPASAQPCDPARPSLKCLSRGVLLTLSFLAQQEALSGVGGVTRLMPSGYFSVYQVADRTDSVPFDASARNSWPKPTFRVSNVNGVDLAGYHVPFGAVIQQHGYPDDTSKFKAGNSAEGSLYNWRDDLTQVNNTAEYSYVNDIMYEPDGLCSLTKAIFLFHNEYPDDGLLDHPWVQKALQAFVAIIRTEINHDNSPYSVRSPLRRLGIPANWPSPVKTFNMDDDAVLTWVGFRPSDEPCVYNYNIPVNLYIATALDSISEMYSDKTWGQTAAVLAKKIAAGVEKYGVVQGKYAYEVDALGNHYFGDDANYPSLYSLPFLVKPDFYDTATYNRTTEHIQTDCSKANCGGQVATQFCDSAQTKCPLPFFHSSKYCGKSKLGLFEGFGSSTESTKHEVRIWPMSIVMRALVSASAGDTIGFWESVRQLSSLYTTLKTSHAQPPSLPESFLACDPGGDPSRNNDSFGWMAATYFLLGRGWWTPEIAPAEAALSHAGGWLSSS